MSTKIHGVFNGNRQKNEYQAIRDKKYARLDIQSLLPWQKIEKQDCRLFWKSLRNKHLNAIPSSFFKTTTMAI
ncbi:MAG: hypothetical protein DRR16_28335 [Candidatus Parabeggiatoa sp. nov. 3]|nr:MAG: hypothetical protein DRR00_18990 [Gammaproteobacteria bacterium]RKZ66060.1 MAG: hypothetical protein DRQ99_10835 [Gammaproteobacteria bacterium]RKZ78115.1 MAG: hypothetical protein DRR16_28335 [Gammaproteobacteria bacterium]HEW97458.1 hypothetical protein [Beggiatoa sp.]